MIKLKTLLTEKKKLDQRFLDDIHKMTQRNNHTLARFQLAKYMGNDKLSLFYSSMENLNKVFGGYGPELSKLNQKMMCSKIETECGIKISIATLAKIKNGSY